MKVRDTRNRWGTRRMAEGKERATTRDTSFGRVIDIRPACQIPLIKRQPRIMAGPPLVRKSPFHGISKTSLDEIRAYRHTRGK